MDLYEGVRANKRDAKGAAGSTSRLARTEDKNQNQKLGPAKRRTGLEYIVSKEKRSITFSKRKKGIMKKAYELNRLTGSEVLMVLASESGYVYSFATDRFREFIKTNEKRLEKCLKRE